HLVVDLGSLEDYPSNVIPGFVEGLLAMLPGIAEHSCSRGRKGGFVERLREGTWLGHVAEHVALQLQQAAGSDIRRGKTRQVPGHHGRYNVGYGFADERAGRAACRYKVVDVFADERVGLAAGRLAVRIVNHLVEPDPELDFDRELEAFLLG